MECVPPVPPANGSITKFSSEGTSYSLEYMCNEGYFPSGAVISTCENEMWSPNPKLALCKGCCKPIYSNTCCVISYIEFGFLLHRL